MSKNGNCERCGMEGALWLVIEPLEDIAVIEDAVWYKEEEKETASEIASDEVCDEVPLVVREADFVCENSTTDDVGLRARIERLERFLKENRI